MHDLDRENRSRLKPSLEQRLPAQRAPAKAMKFGVCFALVHIKVLWILRDPMIVVTMKVRSVLTRAATIPLISGYALSVAAKGTN